MRLARLATLGRLLGVGLLFLCVLGASSAPPLKFNVQLIWGTDMERPEKDKAKYKDLDPKLNEKLVRTLKLKNYYQVDQQKVSVPFKGSKMTCMSHDCVVELFHQADQKVEVHLYGEGKLVQKISQDLPKGQHLVIGGNVKKKENEAWIVAVSVAD